MITFYDRDLQMASYCGKVQQLHNIGNPSGYGSKKSDWNTMIALERMKGKQKKSIEVWDILNIQFLLLFFLGTIKEFSGEQNAGSIYQIRTIQSDCCTAIIT
jgi:hypothetical protein